MQGWLQEPEEQLDSAPAQAQRGPDTGLILHPSLGSHCSPSPSWILPQAQLPLLPGWMGPCIGSFYESGTSKKGLDLPGESELHSPS